MADDDGRRGMAARKLLAEATALSGGERKAPDEKKSAELLEEQEMIKQRMPSAPGAMPRGTPEEGVPPAGTGQSPTRELLQKAEAQQRGAAGTGQSPTRELLLKAEAQQRGAAGETGQSPTRELLLKAEAQQRGAAETGQSPTRELLLKAEAAQQPGPAYVTPQKPAGHELHDTSTPMLAPEAWHEEVHKWTLDVERWHRRYTKPSNIQDYEQEIAKLSTVVGDLSVRKQKGLDKAEQTRDEAIRTAGGIAKMEREHLDEDEKVWTQHVEDQRAQAEDGLKTQKQHSVEKMQRKLKHLDATHDICIKSLEDIGVQNLIDDWDNTRGAVLKFMQTEKQNHEADFKSSMQAIEDERADADMQHQARVSTARGRKETLTKEAEECHNRRVDQLDQQLSSKKKEMDTAWEKARDEVKKFMDTEEQRRKALFESSSSTEALDDKRADADMQHHTRTVEATVRKEMLTKEVEERHNRRVRHVDLQLSSRQKEMDTAWENARDEVQKLMDTEEQRRKTLFESTTESAKGQRADADTQHQARVKKAQEDKLLRIKEVENLCAERVSQLDLKLGVKELQAHLQDLRAQHDGRIRWLEERNAEISKLHEQKSVHKQQYDVASLSLSKDYEALFENYAKEENAHVEKLIGCQITPIPPEYSDPLPTPSQPTPAQPSIDETDAWKVLKKIQDLRKDFDDDQSEKDDQIHRLRKKIESAELLWPRTKASPEWQRTKTSPGCESVGDPQRVSIPPKPRELHLIDAGDEDALTKASVEGVTQQSHAEAMEQLQKLHGVFAHAEGMTDDCDNAEILAEIYKCVLGWRDECMDDISACEDRLRALKDKIVDTQASLKRQMKVAIDKVEQDCKDAEHRSKIELDAAARIIDEQVAEHKRELDNRMAQMHDCWTEFVEAKGEVFPEDKEKLQQIRTLFDDADDRTPDRDAECLADLCAGIAEWLKGMSAPHEQHWLDRSISPSIANGRALSKLLAEAIEDCKASLDHTRTAALRRIEVDYGDTKQLSIDERDAAARIIDEQVAEHKRELDNRMAQMHDCWTEFVEAKGEVFPEDKEKLQQIRTLFDDADDRTPDRDAECLADLCAGIAEWLKGMSVPVDEQHWLDRRITPSIANGRALSKLLAEAIEDCKASLAWQMQVARERADQDCLDAERHSDSMLSAAKRTIDVHADEQQRERDRKLAATQDYWDKFVNDKGEKCTPENEERLQQIAKVFADGNTPEDDADCLAKLCVGIAEWKHGMSVSAADEQLWLNRNMSRSIANGRAMSNLLAKAIDDKKRKLNERKAAQVAAAEAECEKAKREHDHEYQLALDGISNGNDVSIFDHAKKKQKVEQQLENASRIARDTWESKKVSIERKFENLSEQLSRLHQQATDDLDNLREVSKKAERFKEQNQASCDDKIAELEQEQKKQEDEAKSRRARLLRDDGQASSTVIKELEEKKRSTLEKLDSEIADLQAAKEIRKKELNDDIAKIEQEIQQLEQNLANPSLDDPTQKINAEQEAHRSLVANYQKDQNRMFSAWKDGKVPDPVEQEITRKYFETAKQQLGEIIALKGHRTDRAGEVMQALRTTKQTTEAYRDRLGAQQALNIEHKREMRGEQEKHLTADIKIKSEQLEKKCSLTNKKADQDERLIDRRLEAEVAQLKTKIQSAEKEKQEWEVKSLDDVLKEYPHLWEGFLPEGTDSPFRPRRLSPIKAVLAATSIAAPGPEPEPEPSPKN